jgi:PKD repeat protein
MRVIQRRSVRRLLGIVGTAAIAASALVVAGSVAFARTPEIIVTAADNFTANEGSPVTDQWVASFTDEPDITRPQRTATTSLTCDELAAIDWTATINWGDGTDTSTGVIHCTDGPLDVTGTHTYKDSDTYHINVTVEDNFDHVTATGTDMATATINDVGLTARKAANAKGTEGSKVTVEAPFFDNNPAYDAEGKVDPGLTATIDWGDGTAASAGKVEWPDAGSDVNVLVTGDHVYDAGGEGPYTVKVTLHDSGDNVVSSTLKATISDAALTAGTAKSFVAAAAQSSSEVVASFTDAAGAQAAVADFAASITWGDNTTSAGTVVKTADGAFDVSGAHTYTTAGSKTLTITVTDEEGSTLSMTATATVPALPTTGHPQTPLQPSTPLVPMLALVFGLAIALGGSGLVVARRIRH